MKEISTYALGVIVCSALFVVFYRTVLHRYTPFLVARIYLVASLAASAVIPALDIPVWRVAPVEITPGTAMFFDIPDPVPAPAAAPPVDWAGIAAWVIWGAGLAILSFVMTRQIVRIRRIRNRAGLFQGSGCEIALSEEVDTPFSFLTTVFIKRGTSDEDMRQILLHEASHIRHRHSREKIVMEVLKNVLWFNPFGWWAARLLAEVHEFEADRDVLDGGFTVEEYLPLIFRQIFGYNPELSVGLGDSLTKKRFLMMKNKMKFTKYSSLRVAGALPLAAGMMMLFSFTERTPEIIYAEAPAAVEATVEPGQPVFEETVVASNNGETVEVVGNWPASSAQNPQSPDEDIPRFNPEVMPTFEGGNIGTFAAWVQKQIRYPKEAMEKKIAGRVFVRFVIERDGSVSNVEELSSPDKILTDEVVRVLGTSPKWTQGMHSGKAVRVYYIMPIAFALQTESKEEEKPADDISAFWTRGITPFLSPGANPLVYIDGVEGDINSIDENDIESFSILKDAAATSLYGERGKNGVILITTKNGSEVSEHQTVKVNDLPADKQPMIILDGKEITADQIQTLDRGKIASISVLKDASATAVYGEGGKNGVILITSKKEGDTSENITISVDKGGASMGLVQDIVQILREANSTKINYIISR